MGFVATTAATFRDDLLAFWASRYLAAKNKPLDVEPDSEAYAQGDAFSIPVEGLEARALRMTLQIFPDTADDEFVLKHATLIGLVRKLETPSTLSVTVTGAPSATSPVAGATLNAGDGTRFEPVDGSGVPLVDITLDGGGLATILVRALTAGVVGNKPANTVLTWSTAPTGFVGTATVVSIDRPGTDIETFDALARRVLEWWRERPGAGNRADWKDWSLRVGGVVQVFIYPLMHPTLGVGTLGCVTILCLGPAQGDNPDGSTRFLLAGVLTDVTDFIEGMGDAAGNPLSDEGPQLRPVDMAQGDYVAETGIAEPCDVEIFVTNDPANPFPWTGSMTVDGASDGTHLVVTGDHTAKNNKAALVQVGTAFIRGAGQKITLNTGVFAAGVTTWTFGSGELLAAPVASSDVYPAPPNWMSIRLAVFGYFDKLTPGDAAVPSRRWPRESVLEPMTFYRNAMCADVIKAGIGVTNADIPTQPPTDLTPTTKKVITLAKLIIRPA